MMHSNTLKNWLSSSYLTRSNQYYIEQIYKDFLKNPNSVDFNWIKIFKQLSLEKDYENKSSDNVKNDVDLRQQYNVAPNDLYVKTDICSNNITYMKILQLIHSFRTYGHQYAALDPLKLWRNKFENCFLNLEKYNFSSQNLQKKIDMMSFGINKESMTVPEIYEFLKKTYCSSIGIEYMHILDENTMMWIQSNFESTSGMFSFNSEEKKQFLKEITAAEGIERHLGTKFPGVKRFSLEGGDVLIPMLKEMIRHSVYHHNIEEIFLGMAHRGRLNVLINVLGKNPQDLFDEFSGKHQITSNSGDVKYHQGFYSDITVNGKIIHLSLLCNPSHLEIVSPVVMGCARARIDQLFKEFSIHHHNKEEHNIVLPIAIHGDAAISAQGIVQETFNMSKTHAYYVGGTVHIIVNNQVGFTTSNIHDMRSTQYCTDIAKMIHAPIFHVNADDVDAVIYVSQIALNFRNKFKRDVIIDLICYRRHGHNEADEPSVTQPLMYTKIRNHPTLFNIYSNILIKNKIINTDDSAKIINTYRERLDKECCMLQNWQPINIRHSLHVKDLSERKNYLHTDKINNQYLKNLAYRINNIPSNITMHPRVEKIYHERTEMALGNKLFDWGTAEILAYATLLDQGISIRLSGEDTARGTFFHRHVVIYDQNNGGKYIPLAHINKKENEQGSFFIWDSVLSEEATLAFEYGYASLANNMLVIWEAQFGDFSNGAQIVIDQFISSSEQKWGQLCGLVMLLPHGYEGQGPEHSSSRIERYLQLCAEDNICICIPSTPGQIYHILRQQATCSVKKPLILISPKSLLRHPMVVTSLEDLVHGSFKTVLHEMDDNIISNKVNRVIICSGKVYYDLLNQRRKNKQYNIAIIRIEQLYPFPYVNIQIILHSYSYVQDFIWCQEEPKNQGSWYYIQHCFNRIMPSNVTLNYIGRSDSAAPAVGYFSVHQQQQKKIIEEALNLN